MCRVRVREWIRKGGVLGYHQRALRTFFLSCPGPGRGAAGWGGAGRGRARLPARQSCLGDGESAEVEVTLRTADRMTSCECARLIAVHTIVPYW